MTWRDDAACKGRTHLFYPERGLTAHAAKAICAGCPVQVECRAAGAREPFGVWGGTSVDDRGAIHGRGQPDRLEDVRACTECDARVWAARNIPAKGFRCPACRVTDEDVA